MAKNKRKRKGGYKPPPPSKEDVIASIVSLASEIANAENPGPLWGQLHKAFLKSDVDAEIAAKIIMHRDVEELASVVAQLTSGEAISIEEESEVAVEVDAQTKKDALRAFRKRVKFARLDHESKLGVGPLSGGKNADFDSMIAPHDYPMHVWKALAADGDLIDDGGGFFRIP